MIRLSPVLVSFFFLSGCALTSKADIVTTRYFTPEVNRTHLDSGEAKSNAARHDVPELRLGRVTSGAHLRERIAYRDAVYETGYYEELRWTERPEVYVRREIMRKLFEEKGFRRVTGGAAPQLDIDVVAFDELRLPNNNRAARVELKVVLSDSRSVLFEDTITIDRPVPAAKDPKEPRIEELVATMALALDAAAEEVAKRVATAAPAAPTTTPR